MRGDGLMGSYGCVCYVEYEDDGIVVEAGSRSEAVAKARELARRRIDALIRCECYTEKELEEMVPW